MSEPIGLQDLGLVSCALCRDFTEADSEARRTMCGLTKAIIMDDSVLELLDDPRQQMALLIALRDRLAEECGEDSELVAQVTILLRAVGTLVEPDSLRDWGLYDEAAELAQRFVTVARARVATELALTGTVSCTPKTPEELAELMDSKQEGKRTVIVAK